MLTERQKLILSVVVDNYITTAEPIGSRSISKQREISYSPATIRNEMADLEEMGFLEQPHTSSGRVPSNQGYRYYVDYLIKPERIIISKNILNNIRNIFTSQFNEFEHVLEQAANILSQITNYTSIILGPEIFNTKLTRIQIVPISDDNLVVILVTSSGKVEHKTLKITKEVSIHEIESLVNYLNYKLAGTPLYQLKSKIEKELLDEFTKNFTDYEKSMKIINELFSDLDVQEGKKIYLGGTINLLNQPEFNDMNTIKGLFKLFEKTEDVKHLMKSTNSGIKVKIGLENELEAANNCSIITATYQVDGQPLGTIGIFGPTRMDYSRVIRLLDFLEDDFSKYLTSFYKT
ncbi:MAG: heat-inducible transcriptional repressor HrcA [Vulcanibacillus sp.]